MTLEMLHNSPITTVVFDLGGVFYRVDPLRTIRALDELRPKGEKGKGLECGYSFKMPELEAFERGRIGIGSFRDALRAAFNIEANDIQFDTAWNSLMLGVIEENAMMLPVLAEKYRLILLSNNNPLHYAFLEKECESVFRFFEATYFSHLTGLVKPEPEAYRMITDRHSLDASEVLFVDDSEINTQGATAVGFHVLHLKEPRELMYGLSGHLSI